MAKKRLTDPGKWGKKFIRELPSAYKLLWFYLKDVCDHAGVWEVDMPVAVVQVGEPVDAGTALQWYGSRVIVSSDGARWFIPEFIDEQYGNLTSKSNVYIPVMRVLISYGFADEAGNIKGLTRGLVAPDEGAIEGAPKEVINNNNISSNSITGNTVVGNTDTINSVVEPPTEGLARGLQGAANGLTGNVSAYQNVKNGSEMLTVGDCLEAFMVSNVCGAMRELILRRLHDLSDKKLLKEIGVQQLMKEWGLRFNEHLAARLMVSRSLHEWTAHFQNWLNKQSLGSNPKLLHNGNNIKSTGGGNNRPSKAAIMQPGDNFFPS